MEELNIKVESLVSYTEELSNRIAIQQQKLEYLENEKKIQNVKLNILRNEIEFENDVNQFLRKFINGPIQSIRKEKTIPKRLTVEIHKRKLDEYCTCSDTETDSDDEVPEAPIKKSKKDTTVQEAIDASKKKLKID